MKHYNIAFFIPHLGCPNKCSFCEQKSISGSSSPVLTEEIQKTVSREADKMTEEQRKNTEIAYFGGSFTAIDKQRMLEYLTVAKELKDKYSLYGIRISTRPDALSDEILEILKKYSVRDIEIGAQSTDDGVLFSNDRGHTKKDIFEAAERVKQHGFSLGLQIMPGLYKDTEETIMKTVEDVVKMAPKTVRIYPTLTIEGTRLCELYRAGEYKPLSLEKAVKLCSYMLSGFEENNIEIIKMGLHSEKSLEKSLVAGPYHPAFKELCESRLFYDKIVDEMTKNELQKATVFVSPKSISKALGQKRENLKRFQDKKLNITIKTESALGRYEIKIGKE